MAENGDVKANEATYNGFMVLLKWGAVISFVVAFIVIFLLAS